MCPILQQSLITSDTVAGVLQEAAREGNRSLLQLMVKQLFNVESKVGREEIVVDENESEMRSGMAVYRNDSGGMVMSPQLHFIMASVSCTAPNGSNWWILCTVGYNE